MTFQCTLCSAVFTFKQNLKRHETKRCKYLSKNSNIDDGQNVNMGGQNVNMGGQNVNAGGQNVNVWEYQCSKCWKVLRSLKRLKTHEQMCDGSHTLQCKVCLKTFTSRQGKYQHISKKNCVSLSSKEESSTIINNNTNNYNGNVDNSVTNTNITVNNNIVLNVHGKENFDTLLDTIRIKYPQAFVTMVEEGDTASLLKLVHFNKDFPENQTIRKPAKKDVSAEVHLGEGRWEKRPTQDVIQTFKGQTSKHLCDSLQTKVNHKEQNDMYLKEILYEQSKEPKGNTDSLLQPFVLSDQEHELIQRVNTLKRELMREYPTLIGTKMFNDLLKKESQLCVDERVISNVF